MKYEQELILEVQPRTLLFDLVQSKLKTVDRRCFNITKSF